MKKPVEIKKGLAHCSLLRCKHCPYGDDCMLADGCSDLSRDALAYIRQLEAQVGKDMNASRWISVEERLPKNEKTVLIATKWSLMGMHGMAVSCGFHTDGKTFTGDSDYTWNDGNVDLVYDEEEDEYIVPECWWESVRYSDEFSAVDEPVMYWMPLPEAPKEG